MVRNTIGLVTLICSLVIVSSCEGTFTLGKLIPWYAPYVRDTIKLPETLPTEYKEKPVFARSLTGVSNSNLSLGSPVPVVTWIAVVQYRSPDPSRISILDSSFKEVYSTSDFRIGDIGMFAVDQRGNLVVGDITLIPAIGTEGWRKESFVSPLHDGQIPIALYSDTSGDHFAQFTLRLSGTGGGVSIEVSAGYYSSSTVAPPATPSWSGASFTNRTIPFGQYPPNFFPATPPPASLQLTISSLRLVYSNPALPGIEFKCLISDPVWPNFNGRPCVVTVPIEYFSGPPPPPPTSSQAVLVLPNTAGAGSTTNMGGDSRSISTTATKAGFVTALALYSSNDSGRVLPLVFSDRSGVQKATINIPLAKYPSVGDYGFDSGTSSISQRPIPLDGFDDWLVADGLHGCVYRCAPWWQE